MVKYWRVLGNGQKYFSENIIGVFIKKILIQEIFFKS
jgi:hypothetical protein